MTRRVKKHRSTGTDNQKQAPIRLWDSSGKLKAWRVRYLDSGEIQSLLLSKPLAFAVNKKNYPADRIGKDATLIGQDNAKQFWERQAKSQMCDSRTPDMSLDDFPDGYCYTASEWHTESGEVVVLLAVYH